MKLRPVLRSDVPGYPPAGGGLRGLLLAAAVTATSLGGCGGAYEPPAVDAAVDSGDLDGTTQAVPAPGDPAPPTPPARTPAPR